MDLRTKIMDRFIKHKSNVVRYSAFVVLGVIILTILIHANVSAITGGVQSRQPIVQSSQQNLQKEQQKAETGGSIFPVTHTVTPTPTPELMRRSVIVPTDIHTPTPAPTAPPATTGSGGDVTTIISNVFGANAAGAINVARCESGLNPAARNPNASGGSYPAGLFQILYPSTWSTTPEASLSPYDATANAQAAYAIFTRDGNSWREWSCAA